MRERLKDFILQNFRFSNSEIRGVYVLVPFIVIAFTTPSLLQEYLYSRQHDDSQFEEELLACWVLDSESKLSVKSIDQNTKKPLVTQVFDPNTIDIDQWIDKGFTEQVSTRIRKYLDKGGRFHTHEDVLKVYGINGQLAKAYFDYMDIKPLPKKTVSLEPSVPVSLKSVKPKKTKEIKKTFVKFDLNLADTVALKRIRGIGSYYATRLVSYREELGGFIDKDQLLEIYGVDTTIQNLILKHTMFEPVTPEQLNINKAGFDELFKHPYLDYKTVVSILKYRKQHGLYAEVEELKKILTFRDSVYQKVNPYLKVSD